MPIETQGASVLKDENHTSFAMGMNSAMDASQLQNGQYASGMNIVCRGGIAQTRQGFTSYFVLPEGHIQGFKAFQPTDGVQHLVFAVEGSVYYSPYPFVEYFKFRDLQFSPGSRFVVFQECTQTTDIDEDGVSYVLDVPKRVLMMQDRNSRAAFWDGAVARHLDPTIKNYLTPDGVTLPENGYNETPIGLWMAWAGNRLWVATDSDVRASDFGNPLLFTESQYIAEGRSFPMPEDVCGMIQPSNGSELIVFGNTGFTTLKANILDRTQWLSTPFFQTTQSGIGCIAGKSILNRHGLVWWFSQYGWTNLNAAMQYQQDSTQIQLDIPMLESKSMLSLDRQGICSAGMESFILVSVPASDIHNKHTWCGDVEGGNFRWYSYWTGIRPVEWSGFIDKGTERLFCASIDKDGVGRIWEAFRPDRTDNGENIVSVLRTKNHTFSNRLTKRYDHTDIYIDEMLGDVFLIGAVAGRTTGYRKILSKTLCASRGSANQNPNMEKSPTTGKWSYDLTDYEFDVDDDSIASLRPQARIVTTQNLDLSAEDECNICGVESKYTFGVDVEFSNLFVWSGRLGIEGYRMWSRSGTDDDFNGKCEDDETCPRSVAFDGCSSLSDTVSENAFEEYEGSAVFIAQCLAGTAGANKEAGAISTSVISQAEADYRAIASAKLAAESMILCGPLPNVYVNASNAVYVSATGGVYTF